jgi:4-hydroxy-3-methylbut-2-enyl diphosphate reductase
VVINLKGIRVFIPASQTGLGREEPMANLLGQIVRFKITEVNRARKRVVGSIRTVAMRERRERAEKIWAEIEVGKKYTGTVKSMTSYGAFVDIGGVDGMVHVSEISWSRIRKPEDVLSVGQEVEVYVISFDPEKKKISLGYRKAEDNPWTKFTDTYKEGDVATVKVVKFMPFGAFAEIVPGVDGLIHISQIADRRISKPDAVLTVGEEVQAKITAIDNEKQKVSLSIRALIEPEEAPVRERVERKQPEPQGDALVYEISATGEATGFAPEEDEIVED